MSEQIVVSGRWWGRITLPVGEAHHWRIGPTDLWIQHLRNEWRVTVRREGDVTEDGLVLERVFEVPDFPGRCEVRRFAVSEGTDELLVEPALADRAIVTRPETPFQVPPGEQVTVFVSSPLWLKASIGSPSKSLFEMPIYRPSDTWFGASTLDGEVCYASSTRFVLNRENAPAVAHRATTPVHIQNQASGALDLDRLRLPVVNLSLYETAAGRLWTNSATLARAESDEFAELRIGQRGPADVSSTTRICEPREPLSENLVVRAFSKLLQVW